MRVEHRSVCGGKRFAHINSWQELGVCNNRKRSFIFFIRAFNCKCCYIMFYNMSKPKLEK